MVIEDSKGNMFSVEIILEVEHDPTELRLLGEALYEKLLLIEEENSLLKGILSAKEYKERLNLKEIN